MLMALARVEVTLFTYSNLSKWEMGKKFEDLNLIYF